MIRTSSRAPTVITPSSCSESRKLRVSQTVASSRDQLLDCRSPPQRPQGAPARPPGRRRAPRDGRRAGRARPATTACRPPTPTSSRTGSTTPPTPAPWSATWRPSPTRWGSCRPPTRWPGSPPSAPRTSPPTGSSTPRSATRPSCTWSAGWTSPEVVEAVNAGFREGERRAAAAGTPIRVGALLTAMRHAARSMEIAELAVRYRDDGRGRLRHRRRRGRAPADPAPGRLRVPPARERPLHDPRRRGLRAALDLAGHPVVRRRPARPRRPDHRRHHGRPRRRGDRSAGSRPTCATSGSRWRWRRRPTS